MATLSFIDAGSGTNARADQVPKEPGRSRSLVFANGLLQSTAISKTTPNDSSPLFSKALKMDLFAQNNTSALCNQKIMLIEDAALDRKEQYWEGGKTVPANARLVHRLLQFDAPSPANYRDKW